MILTREDLVKMHTPREYTQRTLDMLESGRDIIFMPGDLADEHNYGVYNIMIAAALPNGFKAIVRVTGITPYVDVWTETEDRDEINEFIRTLGVLFDTAGIKYLTITEKRGKTYKKYTVGEQTYCRVEFKSTFSRYKAIEQLKSQGYSTASDATGAYYLIVAKLYDLKISSWLIGTKAAVRAHKAEFANSPQFSYDIEININDLNNCTPPADDKLYAVDRTLVLAWDIETYRKDGSREVPQIHCDASDVFMICFSAHWKDSKEQLYGICLVDQETEPDERWTTIICKNTEGILRNFNTVLANLNPDFLTGFNDFRYDWPFIYARYQKHDLLSLFSPWIGAMNGKKEINITRKSQIKLGAGNHDEAQYISLFGIVPIDVRICYVKLFPKNETTNRNSLKYFLEISGLDSKADLPYQVMHRYHSEARAMTTPQTAINMREIANYCMIDALRCQELLLKRMVINETRDLCYLANDCIMNGFMKAGGSKVNNLLGCRFAKYGYLTSEIKPPAAPEGAKKEKYLGAYVFPPERGLSPNPAVVTTIESGTVDVKDICALMSGSRPIVGLDFASLYPSIICTYNLSPEMMIDDPEEAARLESEGVGLNKISFMYAGKEVLAWSIKHNNNPDMIGVYPRILEELKAHRGEIKKVLAKQAAIKEAYELWAGAAKSQGRSLEEMREILRKDTHAEIMHIIDWLADDPEGKYNTASFEWVKTNAKQSAVKVYMNTFYGEAGNSNSCYFKLALAGGVTLFGRRTIKMVADYVRARGFRIKYGDTDSLYLEAPSSEFAECDAKYLNCVREALAAGNRPPIELRQEWYTQMVEITKVKLNELRADVNKFLIADNGSKFLSMNFEEVMYPVVFCGKKKYYGIPHYEVPNFFPKDLFIRGINIIRQDQSNISRKTGYEIMWRSVRLDNAATMLEITRDVIYNVLTNSSQWVDSDFIMSYTYRPHKKNLTVNQFVERMKNIISCMPADSPERENYIIPEAGDRFNYIVCKRDAEFTIKGNIIKFKKSDLMEYVDVARRREVNLSYYIDKLILGLCARFISGDPSLSRGVVGNSDEDADQDDKATQIEAKKILLHYIREITGAGKNFAHERGKLFRAAYKRAAAGLFRSMSLKGADLAAFNTPIIKFIIEADNDFTRPQLLDYFKLLVENHIGEYAMPDSLKIPPKAKMLEIKAKFRHLLIVGKHFSNDALNGIEAYYSVNSEKIIKFLYSYRAALFKAVENIRGDLPADEAAQFVPDMDAVNAINVLWGKLIVWRKLCLMAHDLIEHYNDVMNIKPENQRAIIEDASERLTLATDFSDFNL